jgi:vitamin K-dependent gamma-carboxylase-like protein
VREWLALDKRSLALFRVFLGLVVLFDILLRGFYFKEHYTSAGVFPLRDFLIQQDLSQRRWSVFFVSDSPFFVGLLFIVFALAALSLTAGYRTRVAGWLCWILLISLYRRNPIVNNSGDYYLPLLLLWGNFLPWAEAFSADSAHRSEPRENYYSALPGFCYLCQVAILYWFSAVLRTGVPWQIDGSALYDALHLEAMNTKLASYLLFLGTDLLALTTFVTLFMEIVGPILLFLPSPRARILGVVLIMSFHLGIFVSLTIPVFALICIVGPLGLIPREFWSNRVGKKVECWFEKSAHSIGSRLPVVTKPSWLELPFARRAAGVYRWIPVLLLGMTISYLAWGIDMRKEPPLEWTLQTLSLDQRWGMFSPRPVIELGFESVPARTESGREVNLLTGEPYSDKPEDIKNNTALWKYRKRSLLISITAKRFTHARLYLYYLVNQWNASHPEDLIVAASWIYHPETRAPRFMLSEHGQQVFAVYHR